MLALAACSGGDRNPRDAAAFDVNAAAARAEGDIANYAAGIPAPAVPALTPAPAPQVTALPETPIAAGSAQAAGDVVRRYYALIEARKYHDARVLWRDGGKASGMSDAAFGASFERYAEYHADIGTPGDVDAGAGQRYVTVPVRINGTIKDGARPFAMAGGIVLHRIAEGIETPDPADHAWRIDKADIRPRPADAAEPGSPNPSLSPTPPDRPD